MKQFKDCCLACISKCNEPTDKSDYTSVTAPVNICCKSWLIEKHGTDKGQRNLLEKVYFNPTQAASFSSAQSLRKQLLSQKRPIKQGQQIKVPTVKDIQLWLMEKRPIQHIGPCIKNTR